MSGRYFPGRASPLISSLITTLLLGKFWNYRRLNVISQWSSIQMVHRSYIDKCKDISETFTKIKILNQLRGVLYVIPFCRFPEVYHHVKRRLNTKDKVYLRGSFILGPQSKVMVSSRAAFIAGGNSSSPSSVRSAACSKTSRANRHWMFSFCTSDIRCSITS